MKPVLAPGFVALLGSVARQWRVEQFGQYDCLVNMGKAALDLPHQP